MTKHHNVKAYRGSGVNSSRILTSELDGGESSASRFPYFNLPQLLEQESVSGNNSYFNIWGSLECFECAPILQIHLKYICK
jgi:hypothetical protein